MIKIAICDDSEKFVSHLDEMLRTYAEETKQDLKTNVFTRPLNFLDAYAGTYDLIFLDIDMPIINGIEVAKRIRSMDKKVSIIFLTSWIKYALDGYKVEAFNYIIKPLSYKRLKMELDSWVHKHIHDKGGEYYVKNDEGRYRIMLRDLVYIETFERNTMIHTKEKGLICYKKLNVLEAELKEQGFVRCHASYIINLAFIKSVEKLEVKLITGDILPIGRAKKKEFMQSLAQYWGEQI